MIKLRRFRKTEKGQMLVEYAMVLPVFLIVLFSIIDLGWLVFQKNTFNYACRRASWEFNMKQHEEYVLASNQELYISGYEADNELTHSFRKTSEKIGYLNIRNIDVSNSTIHIIPGRKTYKSKPPAHFTRVIPGEAEQTYTTTSFEIKGKIKYKVEPLTPMGQTLLGRDFTFENDLYKIRRSRMRLERAY
ncbi:MAG TPA: TadE family protein [Tissierellaceae bacterium]